MQQMRVIPETTIALYYIASWELCSASQSRGSCPLCAKSGLMHRSKKRLFDRLIGGHLNGHGHVEAKRLCGLEVDHQFEFGRLHDWNVGRLLVLENPSGADARLVISITLAGTVAHQTTGNDCLTLQVHRRNSIASGQRDDTFSLRVEVCAGPDK